MYVDQRRRRTQSNKWIPGSRLSPQDTHTDYILNITYYVDSESIP